MQFNDFTKEQREIIAEYVFSFENDILISTDALKLVDLLESKSMIDIEHAKEIRLSIKEKTFDSEELIDILFSSIDEESGQQIMNEYKGIK